MVAIKIAGHPDFLPWRGRAPSSPPTGSRSRRTDSPGILTGASIVFFTYIGFDSVSTAAEECRVRSAICR